MDITSERLTVAVGSASMGAYLARPVSGGPHPGVVVFMEIFGINNHIRAVTDRIAGEGYVALAPDVFHRTGPGVELEYNEQGLTRGIALMEQAKASEAIADTRAAIATLQARSDVGGRGIGAMGFCFGGHLTYLAACELPIAAAASYYGGGVAVGAPGNEAPPTIERTSKIKGRVACFFGANDPYITAEQAEAVRKALDDAGVRNEVVIYPGVGHGFNCDERGDYDKTAADDAWLRTTSMFREELR